MKWLPRRTGTRGTTERERRVATTTFGPTVLERYFDQWSEHCYDPWAQNPVEASVFRLLR